MAADAGMALLLMNSFMGFLTCGTKSDFLFWCANEQHVADSTYRLPQTTQPLEYWLEIDPHMMAKTFKGEVKIDILAKANTNDIILHSKDLDILNVKVTTVDEKKTIESSYAKNDDNNTLIITTKSEQLLEKNRYKVKILFAGVLPKNNPFGFVLYWRTKYERGKKDDAYLTNTLLEPLFARKAFPCYDEVQYRTPFTISITKFFDETAISNMPSTPNDISDPKYGSKKLRVFEKTSPIPTHMVMYAIFNESFQSISSANKYYIWTMEEFHGESKYPLNVLTNVAEKMQEVFANVVYKPRIDLRIVVHPKMWIQSKDNPWGSMLYVGNQFLCEPKYCWASYQQQIITNIIREVTYKWFGNYVSIDSWNYLWLKDGFAKYFGFELTEQEYVPNNNIFDFFKTRPYVTMSQLHGSIQMQSILNDDARIFFNPITRQGDLSMRDIFQMYKYEDYEFYNGKAALILRMLEHIVGRPTFIRALQRYLTFSNQYDGGLVKPANLWEAFKRQLEEDKINLHLPKSKSFAAVMDDWTESAGYPLVVAKKPPIGDIHIRQIPYLTMAQEHRKNVIEKKDWVIPITIATQMEPDFEKTTPTAWCVDEIILPAAHLAPPNQWYILNVQNTGYYRVNYEDDNWLKLIKQLFDDPTRINVLNRAQLVSDSHQLAIDGIVNIEIPIMLSRYLTSESDPIVWTVAFRSFKRFYLALSKHLRKMYQEFFVPLLKIAYKKFQFQVNGNNDRVTKMWRNEMLNFLCWIGEVECVTEAEKMYQDNEKNLAKIDPDLQFVVFCTVLRGGLGTQSLEKFMENKTQHNICLTDVLHKAKNCAAYPRSDTGFVAMFETLLARMLKNDSLIAKSIISELSTYWNTALLLLERIQLTIDEWRISSIDDSNIKALANIIEYMEGKVTGTAEIRILDQMIKMVEEMRNEKFEPIKFALLTVYNSIERTGEITNRKAVEASLLKWSYIDLKNSAANKQFFDEIQTSLPQDELNDD